MLSEYLQDQAALYAAGSLTVPEREQCEILVEFHEEFRALVSEFAEVTARVTLAASRASGVGPSTGLKARLAAVIATLPQSSTPEGLVVSGPDRLVQWVNSSFSDMCGYQLEELRGRSLGPLLQGEKTDQAAADRMRQAVHECQPCRETILNYHKDGTPYWVEVAITPIRDDQGAVLWLVARERELIDRAA